MDGSEGIGGAIIIACVSSLYNVHTCVSFMVKFFAACHIFYEWISPGWSPGMEVMKECKKQYMINIFSHN